jgi:phosphotransacetylase
MRNVIEFPFKSIKEIEALRKKIEIMDITLAWFIANSDESTIDRMLLDVNEEISSYLEFIDNQDEESIFNAWENYINKLKN